MPVPTGGSAGTASEDFVFWVGIGSGANAQGLESYRRRPVYSWAGRLCGLQIRRGQRREAGRLGLRPRAVQRVSRPIEERTNAGQLHFGRSLGQERRIGGEGPDAYADAGERLALAFRRRPGNDDRAAAAAGSTRQRRRRYRAQRDGEGAGGLGLLVRATARPRELPDRRYRRLPQAILRQYRQGRSGPDADPKAGGREGRVSQRVSGVLRLEQVDADGGSDKDHRRR